MARKLLLMMAALTLAGTLCGRSLAADTPIGALSGPSLAAGMPDNASSGLSPAAGAPDNALSRPSFAADTPDNVPGKPSLTVNTLADIKARGVLVAGVRDTAPPFGTVHPRTYVNEGYDIDFVRYLAKKLGVRVRFQPVTAVNRIPMLMEGRVDLLAAAMTKTPERAQQIDFSHTYFLTGQKFLAQKGIFKTLKDFKGKKIGTARGTTSEQNAADAVPEAAIISFDDYPKAITALRKREIQAVTTDEAILAGQLCLLEKSSATRGKFEISSPRISTEQYAFGVRKGDVKFLKFVNDTMLEMEQNGEAKKIFQRWFGPGSESPINRGDFVIAGTP